MGRRPKLKIEKKSAVKNPRLEFCPPPPRGMPAVGVEYWQRIVPLLVSAGSLGELHLEPLEVLCRAWAEYRRLSDWLAEDASRYTKEDRYGGEIESVQSKRLRALTMELNRLWAKFGLTPQAETQLERRASGGRGRATAGLSLKDVAARKTDGDAELFADG